MISKKETTDQFIKLIILTIAILGILHVGLAFFNGSKLVLAEIPMFVPMLFGFEVVAAFCIIVMALGRNRVLHDPLSYWIAIAFINLLIGNIFVILTWPGLLANGLAIIESILPGTSPWLVSNEYFLMGCFLLVAAVSPWPGIKFGQNKRHWIISLVGWIVLLTIPNILIMVLQDHLPVMLSGETFVFSVRTITTCGVLFLFATAVFLLLRYYARTRDNLAGFIAMGGSLMIFVIIEQLMFNQRYAVMWYASRLIGMATFLIIMFGLLREYILMYKKEREKRQQLLESERKINELLTSITDSFYILDNNWIVTQANDNALAYFEIKRENFIGKNYWDVLPITKGTFIEENFRKAVNENITISFEFHSMLKDAWAEMHLYPSNDGLSVNFRDITIRKQAEERLKESEQLKSELLEKMNQTQQIAKIGSWDWNSQTQKVWWSFETPYL